MPKLVIIPTPIGNLGDITLRAIDAIRDVDWLLTEDTRVASRLLKHLGIRKEMVSYHMHNEHRKLDSLMERILSSELVGLISDAGTPGISDPGYLLIRSCIDHGILLECLPGPAALIPAVVLSGFPFDRFVFEGFLPHKKGRMKRLEALAAEERTMVFYESPYRLIKFLEQGAAVFGMDRQVSVSRELTKLYEETVRGTFATVLHHFGQKAPKGEFIVVVRGSEERNS